MSVCITPTQGSLWYEVVFSLTEWRPAPARQIAGVDWNRLLPVDSGLEVEIYVGVLPLWWAGSTPCRVRYMRVPEAVLVSLAKSGLTKRGAEPLNADSLMEGFKGSVSPMACAFQNGSKTLRPPLGEWGGGILQFLPSGDVVFWGYRMFDKLKRSD